METSVGYADAEKMLKAYYEQEYEGCEVGYKITSERVVKYDWDDDAYSVMEKCGELTVKRVVKGLNNDEPLLFVQKHSESEMREVLEGKISAIFAREGMKVKAVIFGTNAIQVNLEKSNVKKLVLSR